MVMFQSFGYVAQRVKEETLQGGTPAITPIHQPSSYLVIFDLVMFDLVLGFLKYFLGWCLNFVNLAGGFET